MSHLGEKHFTDRHDYRQAQADLIQKGLYGGLPAEDLILKGGPGSGKHKVGDRVKDKDGKIGKVTHANDKEVSVDYDKSHDGVDTASYKHGELSKVEKAEGDVNDGAFDKAITAEAGEGVTQKESVEHNPKDMQNPKSSDLKKAFEVLGIQS